MPAIAQFIANRLNTQKSTSTRSLSMSLGTPADCFMQNKPNLLNAQMNINKVLTKDYENARLRGPPKNKANSKPIQSQFMPKQTQYKANFNTKYAKQTQIKPNLVRLRRIQKGHPKIFGILLNLRDEAA